jgi:hypothetical protein
MRQDLAQQVGDDDLLPLLLAIPTVQEGRLGIHLVDHHHISIPVA